MNLRIKSKLNITLKTLPFVFALSLFFFAGLSVQAGVPFYTLPFEKLLQLAVCAEMKTLGQDCGAKPEEFDERSKALETGLEDLWAMNYGEKTPRKVREASRMLRGWARFDLEVLIKNPGFAKAVLLRAETGVQYLLENGRKNFSRDRLRLPGPSRKKALDLVQKAEGSYAKGKFSAMRLLLYQALWLADPVTADEPMPDPTKGQGLVDSTLLRRNAKNLLIMGRIFLGGKSSSIFISTDMGLIHLLPLKKNGVFV